MVHHIRCWYMYLVLLQISAHNSPIMYIHNRGLVLKELLQECTFMPCTETVPDDRVILDIMLVFPDDDHRRMKNRLPGPPTFWSNVQLQSKPDRQQREQWQQMWNPYSQCSWPPEDELIENFRQAVFDKAASTSRW